jgi:hypothetical protein
MFASSPAMFDAYEDYLNVLESFATKDGISEFRVAREAYHTATGKFEDGEPWFEIRMMMFMDWFLLDRQGRNGLTPIEAYLTERGHTLSPEVFRQMAHLTSTLRSAFQIASIKDNTLYLNDLIRGGEWEVTATSPTAGLEKSDIIDARIAYFGRRPIMCKGIVLHPREAADRVLDIIARSRSEGMAAAELVDHLDKMRLKLDKYSNVRIQHIYRHPSETRL